MKSLRIYQSFWIGIIGAFWLIVIAAFLYVPYVGHVLRAGQRSISIFVWSDLIDPQIIKDFEQQTGIRVFVNYYESNDELLTKLRFVKGTEYDLFIPSHYIVRTLIKNKLIKKIDKTKLAFWHDIDPRFLCQSCDPHNEYIIPFVWDIYGMGIDTRFFVDKVFDPSWRMLFEPPYAYRVGMTNEPREVVAIASMYLYGNTDILNKKKRDEIARLLFNQKQFVEVYTDLTTDFLLTSGTCPVVLAPNNAVNRARKRVPWVSFVLPREGTVMALENVTISSQSTKDELVYAFINFLYTRDSIKKTCDRYGYLPVLTSALNELHLDYLDKDQVLGSYFKTIKLIRPLMLRHRLFEFWLALKAY